MGFAFAYVPGIEDLVITATSRRSARHAIARHASSCRRRSGARATGATAPSTVASLASR